MTEQEITAIGQRIAAYKVALTALNALLMHPIKDLPGALDKSIACYQDMIANQERRKIELEETLAGR